MIRLARMFAVVIVIITLNGCAAMKSEPDYSGADAGYLVVAMGEGVDTNYSSYKLFYQNINDPKIAGALNFNSAGFIGPPTLDFKGEERGVVLIKKLPPGDYKLINFEIYMNGANLVPSMWWKSKDDFSIPFKISTGTGTYLGDFKAVGQIFRSVFGLKHAIGGAYFVVSDKSSRDIPVAKQKLASLDRVDISIPNVDDLNNSLIRSKESPPVMESW